MCAILGSLQRVSPETFQRALERLVHRGGDAQNIVRVEEALFGFNRLAIERISDQSQPFVKNHVCVLFNGEIYNYKDLIKTYSLDERLTEVEVIYALYKKLGVHFVKELDGMFAIGIYDKRVYLFRDIFGKKPLYFTPNAEIFSSEIKGITALLETTPGLNYEALSEYLSLNSSLAPNTIFEGIYKLPAGCYYDGEIRRYYDFSRETEDITHKEAQHEVIRLLKRSIAKRKQGEVEIGSLLSGGLDSSLIATLSGVKETYSIGYDGYENYDERKWAKFVADHNGQNLNTAEMGKETFFETLDEVATLLDEPVGDSAYLPAYHLAKQIPLKVVFSGEGSDELFLGYRKYKEYEEFDKSFVPNRMWMKKFMDRNPENLKEWEMFRRFFAGEAVFRGLNENFYQHQINAVMYEPREVKYERFLPFKDSFRFTYFDMKVWLGEVLLMKLDKMFMAHTIEARTPFLDKALVEFVFSLPEEVRGMHKVLLKKAAEPYLPREIIERRKKGFAYPFFEWLKEENGFREILDVNRKTKIFNEFILKDYVKSGHKRFKQHLWTLYILSKWLKKHYL